MPIMALILFVNMVKQPKYPRDKSGKINHYHAYIKNIFYKHFLVTDGNVDWRHKIL